MSIKYMALKRQGYTSDDRQQKRVQYEHGLEHFTVCNCNMCIEIQFYANKCLDAHYQRS